MAVNGAAEAFVFSVSSSKELPLASIGLVLSLGSFAASAPILLRRHGAAGLVVANAAGLALRAATALTLAGRWLRRQGGAAGGGGGGGGGAAGAARRRRWRRHWAGRALPHPATAAALAGVFLVTRRSKRYFLDMDLEEKTADPIFGKLSLLLINSAATDPSGLSVDSFFKAAHICMGLCCFLLLIAVIATFELDFYVELKILKQGGSIDGDDANIGDDEDLLEDKKNR